VNSTVMKGSGMPFARSGSRGATVHIDKVTVGLVLSILLLGLVMVTSASISIASKESGDAFSYLERQLVLCLIGFALAALVFCVRTEYLEKTAHLVALANQRVPTHVVQRSLDGADRHDVAPQLRRAHLDARRVDVKQGRTTRA